MRSASKFATIATFCAAAFSAAPANAANYLLDFNSSNCTTTCGNFDYFLQSYGDAPGVDLVYRSVASPGNAATTNAVGLEYWSTGYGDLVDVAWGGSSDTSGVPEIKFLATGTEGITLLRLETAGWPNTDKTTDFRVYDLAYNLLYSSGTVTAPGQGHYHVEFGGIFNQQGLILQWGPSGYNAGIDNLEFSVGNLIGGVPEPSAWAMMLSGFGIVGGVIRKRTQQAALA
jgi:hypothetical protein